MTCERLIRAARARALGALPARRLVIVTSARATIGGGTLLSAPYWPDPLDRLAHWSGVMFCMFAVYGMVGHIEAHAMDAVVRTLDVVAAALRRRVPSGPLRKTMIFPLRKKRKSA